MSGGTAEDTNWLCGSVGGMSVKNGLSPVMYDAESAFGMSTGANIWPSSAKVVPYKSSAEE